MASLPERPRRGSAKTDPPPPAQLVSSRLHLLPSQLLVAELFFDVPLDYRDPDGEKIRLFGRAAFKHEKPIVPSFPWGTNTGNRAGTGESDQDLRELFGRPWLVYLEGGPGVGNRPPQDHPFTRVMLNRGYQVLFLDYRGTGLSSPITAATLRQRGPAAATQAAYVRLFRADTIVRDLEAVRACLTCDQPANKRKWSLLGQSFGGFVSLTYLSFYPDGLREVFVTGGLAPVGQAPETVYRATFRKAQQRNAAYFGKYPEDRGALQQIAAFLHGQPDHRLPLPGGGALTMQRLLTSGYMFGFHGGLDTAHALVLRMRVDLERTGLLTRPTLVAVEQFFALDTMPLYGALHEAIYCHTQGVASRWAAQRVAAEFAEFRWAADDVVAPDAVASVSFSTEMIFPFMFDTFPELIEMKEVAQLLADYDEWDDLYDEAQLAANRVPVYAASFIDDLYVDFELARETARKVGAIRVFETNGLYHNAIRARTEEVLTQLFRLRDDSID
ncbi:proline iminopeptidase [Niveomyces insectorum RCEF 264]|uniref:Proline iminopeptidase n=1 Tax=Niveomyces insectorum RCEF 264 TaxID=1081102 RepID=A0A167ZTV1_9HYPO|nr:proline iminopeptidase [Niveomyces insectorum RCEF 264]